MHVSRHLIAFSAGAAVLLACGTSGDSGGDGGAGLGEGGSGGSSGSTGSGGGGDGSSSSGSSSGAGSGSGSSGTGSSSGSSSSSGGTVDDGGACQVRASDVRITEIDVGLAYVYQEVDANGGDNIGLAPLVISAIPQGGSRLAFMGKDGMVHVAQLDASDHLVAGSVFGLPAFDF